MPISPSFASFEQELNRLVGIFERGLAEFKSPGYVEAQLRGDFLNPFFRALGWDLENSAGLIQTKREVEIESRMEIGGRQKRADYLFRTEGHDRFVCEAKKPAEELHSRYAFQAKRYAWNTSLPLAILSDFEEFKIYIVGGRPRLEDDPLVGLWKTWHFRELPLVASEIWNLLARDQIANGSIDKLLESLPTKPRGDGRARQQWLIKPDRTRSLDVDFLNLLDEARRELASDLLKHNDRADLLEGTRLNEAVQRILDRILFLRICEDRDIDTGRPLAAIVETWRRNYGKEQGRQPRQKPLELLDDPPGHYGSDVLRVPKDSLWHAIVQQFRELDRRPPSLVPFFNGNLFKKHLCEDLIIGDDWLAHFIDDLSDEESVYLFQYIPVEILGTIYERFLGKIVRPQGMGVRLDPRPDLRKDSGVYYTPRYVVEYIVEQTVEKLLRKVKPEASLKLHFLDPACGSGSFLIRVFEVVCEYWQQWLTDYPENRKKKWCWLDKTGNVHLTLALKRQILTSNIFGVDLDPGAVEVTQLSLYLKMIENENRSTILRERSLLPGDEAPLLPPLENNIKNGNSLIAPNFLMNPDDIVRLRTFDWNVGFADIMKSGGFDAVIGNPPYLNIDDTWGKGDIQLEAIKLQYPHVYNDKTDILFYFIAKAFDLSRNKIGFIVSRAFLEAFKADKLRGFLADKCAVERIVDFQNFYVFDGVGITTCLLFLEKKSASATLDVYKLLQTDLVAPPLRELLSKQRVFEHHNVTRSSLSSAAWTFASPAQSALNAKLDTVGEALGEILHIGQGMQTGCNEVFGDRSLAEMRMWRVPKELFRFRASNSDIQRYEVLNRGEVLLYVEGSSSFKELPQDLRDHLESYSNKLKMRAAFKRGNCDWWRFTWPLHREYYSRARLVSPFLATENRFAIVEDGKYIGLTDTIVLFDKQQPESLKYLLALLNSRLLTLRFRSIGKLKGGGIYEYFWNSVSKLPIRRIDFKKSADKARHDRMVALADKMLGLMPKLRQARDESERQTLQNAITSTEQQIDALVYELYGLTKAEIKLVEDSV